MKMDKFTIRLLPGVEPAVDGHRTGEIRIGSFLERFAVHPVIGSFDDIADLWNRELRRLVDGAPAVGLPTAPNMAWVLYRVGNDVFVRQLLMLPGIGPDLARDGSVVDIPERAIMNEDGDVISEWATTVEAVSVFLAT